MNDWRIKSFPRSFVLCMLSITCLTATADPVASVTVAFSVYLPPTESAADPFTMASDNLNRCEDFLATTDNPDIQVCQSGQTVYSWQDSQDHTLLTVAPI